MSEDNRTLEKRLADAEAKIATLTEELQSLTKVRTTLTAPFRVVDENGSLLLEVERTTHETSLRLFNTRNVIVASLGAQAAGGFLAIRNDAGKLVGYLSVEMAGARLLLNGNGHEGGLAMGTDDTDGGWLNILNVNGDCSVTLGSDPHGGFLDVHNARSDRAVITLTATADGGNIEVTATSGDPIFDAADAGMANKELQSHDD